MSRRAPNRPRSLLHRWQRWVVCGGVFVAVASARNLWNLTPDEFSASPAGRAVLELGTFNHEQLSAAVFHETNRVRARLGLPRFQHLGALDRAADVQATTNALNQDASHLSVVPGVASPDQRVRHFGLRPHLVCENAALVPLLDLDPSHGFGEKTINGRRVILDGETLRPVPPHTYASFAAALVRSWMASPPHCANIVNPQLTHLGCGARPSRAYVGLDMVACIQEFYTPQGRN